MPYYYVTRESTAIQSCFVVADNPEHAKELAAEAPDSDWETDDIEPCKCKYLWEVEEE